MTFSENFSNLELRDVVCDVFQYVSEQIAQRPSLEDCPPGPVRIYIDDEWTGNGAAATPYYASFFTRDFNPQRSIIHNRIFTKINGGLPSGPQFSTDSDFSPADGKISLNPTLNYYYNWEGGVPATGSGETDAFTIVLHEAVHLLGAAASMGTLFYMTVWDRFLFAEQFSYITGSTDNNTWSVNPSFVSGQTLNDCGNNQTCVELTWANEALAAGVNFDSAPTASGGEYPVPGGLLNGNYPLGAYLNSISHFGEGIDDALDASLYLMAPVRPSETVFGSSWRRKLICYAL